MGSSTYEHNTFSAVEVSQAEEGLAGADHLPRAKPTPTLMLGAACPEAGPLFVCPVTISRLYFLVHFRERFSFR